MSLTPFQHSSTHSNHVLPSPSQPTPNEPRPYSSHITSYLLTLPITPSRHTRSTTYLILQFPKFHPSFCFSKIFHTHFTLSSPLTHLAQLLAHFSPLTRVLSSSFTHSISILHTNSTLLTSVNLSLPSHLPFPDALMVARSFLPVIPSPPLLLLAPYSSIPFLTCMLPETDLVHPCPCLRERK